MILYPGASSLFILLLTFLERYNWTLIKLDENILIIAGYLWDLSLKLGNSDFLVNCILSICFALIIVNVF